MIAVREQAMIEVFVDADGQIIIKQINHQMDDSYISFWPEHAQAVIGAIKQAEGEITARALGDEVPK